MYACESLVGDGGGVIPFGKKLGHFFSFGVEVRVIRADATEPEELGERNAVFCAGIV